MSWFRKQVREFTLYPAYLIAVVSEPGLFESLDDFCAHVSKDTYGLLAVGTLVVVSAVYLLFSAAFGGCEVAGYWHLVFCGLVVGGSLRERFG